MIKFLLFFSCLNLLGATTSGPNTQFRTNDLVLLPLGTDTIITNTGAIAGRLLKDRFADVVDVISFGANPADGNDDYSAFLAANALATASNKTILVPPGRYKLNTTLKLTAPIIGYGDVSILEPTNAIWVSGNGIGLKDLKVNSYKWYATYLTNSLSTNNYFDNVTFTFDSSVSNVIRGALDFDSFMVIDSSFSEGMRIENCRMDGGVQMIRANNLTFRHNRLDGHYLNMNELLHASSKSRVIVEGNYFLNSSCDPLDLYSSGDACRVVNNVFDGSGDPAALVAAGFNEAFITMKIVLTDGVNSSGPILGWTENTIITGNTFRNGRPTIDNSRWFGIMLKMEDLRTNNPTWQMTNASRNVIVQNNIFDGWWTNNPNGFTNNFFAGIKAEGSGLDISHNVFRNISLQGNASSASSQCGIEFGFNFGTPIGTALIGSHVSHNTYEGEGTGIIIFNATNCVVEGNIVQQDYASPIGLTNTLTPRYGIIIYGNLDQVSIINNHLDPTFTNPGGILQLGSTNYIVDSYIAGNFTTKRTPLQVYLPRLRGTDVSFNKVGPITLGTDGDIQYGNSVLYNKINGSPSLPGLDMYSQRDFQIIGNKFTNILYAMSINGGTGTTNTVSGTIHDNISQGENGTFAFYTNISAISSNTITRYQNTANQTLVSSGGTMNLGGAVNVGNLQSSAYVLATVNSAIGWLNNSYFISSAPGVITLYDNTVTNFIALNFGGNTTNYNGMRPTTSGLSFKDGTGAWFTNIIVKNIKTTGINTNELVIVGTNGFFSSVAASNYQAAFTTGVGVTNIGGVMSANIGAGTNIVLTTNGTQVIVNNSLANAGEANTGSNLGSGKGVFNQKSAVDLQFNSLVAGTYIDITSNANQLTISLSTTNFSTATNSQIFNKTGGVYTNTVTYALVDFATGNDLQISLPAAGTYIVTAEVDYWSGGSTFTQYYKFRNTSAGADIANSERIYDFPFVSVAKDHMFTMSNLITVGSASTIAVYSKVDNITYDHMINSTNCSIMYIRLQ